MLNWIQVWRVGWIVGNIDIVACKKSLHYIRGMDPRIVLLEFVVSVGGIKNSDFHFFPPLSYMLLKKKFSRQ